MSCVFREEKNAFDEAVYTWEFMGVHVFFCEDHGMEDDGIEFSNYTHSLSFKSYAGGRVRSERLDLARCMALIIAGAIWDEFKIECMVVDGLQKLLKTYPVEEPKK